MAILIKNLMRKFSLKKILFIIILKQNMANTIISTYIFSQIDGN